MIFKVIKWGEEMYCISDGNNFIHRDGTIKGNAPFKKAYWETKKEAEIFLAGWLTLNPLPKPKLDQVDLEPQYEIGTRYMDSVGRSYRYVKIDCGQGLVQHQWTKTNLF